MHEIFHQKSKKILINLKSAENNWNMMWSETNKQDLQSISDIWRSILAGCPSSVLLYPDKFRWVNRYIKCHLPMNTEKRVLNLLKRYFVRNQIFPSVYFELTSSLMIKTDANDCKIIVLVYKSAYQCFMIFPEYRSTFEFEPINTCFMKFLIYLSTIDFGLSILIYYSCINGPWILG